jgi:rhodanese-related sulfurtransferase
MRAMAHTGLLVCLAGLALIGAAACGVPEPQVPRMSVAAAFARHGDPDTLFLDVRTERTWLTSALKIAGAVHEDPDAVGEWAGRYDQRATIICYCT